MDKREGGACEWWAASGWCGAMRRAWVLLAPQMELLWYVFPYSVHPCAEGTLKM